MKVRALFGLAVVAACESASSVPPAAPGGPFVQAPVSAPSAPSAPPAPGDACAGPPGARPKPLRASETRSPVAGQMTEQAAQAKRLFDMERWPEAEEALARVASGETGDDAGNRMLADFHRAVALFRQRRYAEAAARFRVFAASPAHLKHLEAILWLAKLAEVSPPSFQLGDLAPYTEADIARFDNPSQRELFGKLAYMLGHVRYDEGELEAARSLLTRARATGPWVREADLCLARLGQPR